MTILEKNQKLLRESAAITGRTLKEDGTVVNLADLTERIANAVNDAGLIDSLLYGTDANGDSQAIGTTGDAAHTRDQFAYAAHTSNIFHAACLDTGAALIYVAAPSITDASIPRITSTALGTIGTVDRITMSCAAAHDATGPHNHIGWLVMLNAANETAAGAALTNALTVASGNDIMAYGVEMTPDAALGNIIFIPATGENIVVDLDFTLTSVFVLPIAMAITAIGTSVLSIDLGVPA